MITGFLYNYVETYSNQIYTQNLTFNYTIVMTTNLNINLYSDIMNHVFQIYDEFDTFRQHPNNFLFRCLSDLDGG